MIEEQHTTIALEETAVQELASHLRDALLRPGDADYEQAHQARISAFETKYQTK